MQLFRITIFPYTALVITQDQATAKTLLLQILHPRLAIEAADARMIAQEWPPETMNDSPGAPFIPR